MTKSWPSPDSMAFSSCRNTPSAPARNAFWAVSSSRAVAARDRNERDTSDHSFTKVASRISLDLHCHRNAFLQLAQRILNG